MDTTKHTPGPWRVGAPLKHYAATVLGQGVAEAIADVCDFGVYARDAECAANARLIAAAPDMLEALRVVASLPGFEHDEPYSALVAAAIAKATGA